jgi:hypothetical protein
MGSTLPLHIGCQECRINGVEGREKENIKSSDFTHVAEISSRGAIQKFIEYFPRAFCTVVTNSFPGQRSILEAAN